MIKKTSSETFYLKHIDFILVFFSSFLNSQYLKYSYTVMFTVALRFVLVPFSLMGAGFAAKILL